MTRLTVLEAATYFGISKRTVFRRISEGKFKSEKVNAKVLVILDDDNVAKIDMQKELEIKELELEVTGLRQQLEMQIQQTEFFRNECDRLQLQVLAGSASNRGIFGRLRSLFGGQRELPRSEGLT
tara:strand:+ start:218 stop:592 length:375 start_codon:yes stop_codon:yes gene_type:complete